MGSLNEPRREWHRPFLASAWHSRFLLSLPLVALTVATMLLVPGRQVANNRWDDELERLFVSPPSEYAPSCNLWFFGGAYTPDDIHRALGEMKEQGLGGFRIFPIYPLAEDDATHNIHNARYLSPEFLQQVQETIQSGLRMGFLPDVLLGDGWPFGGPFIPPELGAGQLNFYSQEVHGPTTFTGSIPGKVNPPEKLLAVEAAQTTAEGDVDLTTLIDLTPRVTKGILRDWNIPPGRWMLMTFVSGYTGMKVKRASLGGEGLVLDHFSRRALDLYLERNAEVQKPYLQGVRSVFMDSWEVFDSNWTPTLPEEFQKRRGYSLTPYLPALFLPTGEQGARVRFDFRRTISDLALANFFVPLRDWAHRNGLQTRIQAHGTPADILEAYGLNDYPEGEAYGPEDRRRINIRDRKLASSAGHEFGRNQISAESFTWLRFPLFTTTLENMKAAADAIYLDGLNQIYYHGVPLSPAWVEPPGWYYYAATFVSPGNTWWRYLKNLSDYLRRCDFMLQQGSPAVEVAVYLPTEDVWSNAYGGWFDLAGSLEKHLNEGGASSPARALEALREGGFDFDFINAHRIIEGQTTTEGLIVGPMKYSVVVLPALQAIDVDALEHLRDFCRAGGTVVALGRLPDRSPGMPGAEVETRRLRQHVRDIFGNPGTPNDPPWNGEKRVSANVCGKGQGIFIERDDYQELNPQAQVLPRVISRIIPEDILIEPHDAEISFVHRKTRAADVFFIANISPNEKHVMAKFRPSYPQPSLFDALSGAVTRDYEFRAMDNMVELPLVLEAWDSVFVVFRPGDAPIGVTDTNVKKIVEVNRDGTQATAEVEDNGEFYARAGSHILKATVGDLPAPLRIRGPWRLKSTGVEKELEALGSWTQFPELRDFSGTASYQTDFTLPPEFLVPSTKLGLDLGEVADVGEVILNGRQLPAAWKHPYTVDVTDAVKAGANLLEVRVTNRLINRMRVSKNLGGNLPSTSPETLRDYVPQPVASGLLGPVRLRATRVILLTQ